jgi:Uma2 family endonuclease
MMVLKAISTAALPLRQWPAPGEWTYEDYLAIPDDGNRYEVIYGELYLMSPAPTPIHQLVSAELMYMLQTFIKKNHLGVVLGAPCDVILDPGGTPVEPDILFITRARTHIIAEKNILGAPDMIMEILSPSNPEHDRITKFNLYQESGVKEYWIVDPQARTIEVLVLREGKYAQVGRFEGDAQARSDLLKDFQVALTEVFPAKE